MATRRQFLALLGLGGAALASGGALVVLLPDGKEKTDGPPEIAYDSDSCAHCRMLISDPRFAASWRDNKGDAALFDDIGCMVVQSREHPPAEPVRFWVHDYKTSDWLDASVASFVVDPVVKSPMAYGIAAAASAANARTISTTSEVTDWASILSTVEARG